MQMLKAETCVRRKNGLEMSGMDETGSREGGASPGDSVPRPLGFTALMPIPGTQFNTEVQLHY